MLLSEKDKEAFVAGLLNKGLTAREIIVARGEPIIIVPTSKLKALLTNFEYLLTEKVML